MKIQVDVNTKTSKVSTFTMQEYIAKKASPFLSAEIARIKTEGNDVVVKLPNVTTQAFEIFWQWVYRHVGRPDRNVRKIQVIQEIIERSDANMFKKGGTIFADTWKLAEKVDSTDFKNWLVNMAHRLFCSGNPRWSSLVPGLMRLNAAGLIDCAPYHMLTEVWAYYLVVQGSRHSWWGQLSPSALWSKQGYEQFEALTRANPDLLLALFQHEDRMSEEKERNTLVHPCEHLCDKWHVHDKSEDKDKCAEPGIVA
jgi:hypothetical protein